MAPYQIFTDAAADCSPQWFASLPPIGRHPYAGRDWQSGMYIRSGTISAKHFYDLQKAGNYASASQITPIQYFQSFEPALSAETTFCICVFLRHVRNFSVSSSVCGGITRGRLFAKGRPLVYIVKEHGAFFHPSTLLSAVRKPLRVSLKCNPVLGNPLRDLLQMYMMPSPPFICPGGGFRNAMQAAVPQTLLKSDSLPFSAPDSLPKLWYGTLPEIPLGRWIRFEHPAGKEDLF